MCAPPKYTVSFHLSFIIGSSTLNYPHARCFKAYIADARDWQRFEVAHGFSVRELESMLTKLRTLIYISRIPTALYKALRSCTIAINLAMVGQRKAPAKATAVPAATNTPANKVLNYTYNNVPLPTIDTKAAQPDEPLNLTGWVIAKTVESKNNIVRALVERDTVGIILYKFVQFCTNLIRPANAYSSSRRIVARVKRLFRD
jgi:hypothetical protein